MRHVVWDTAGIRLILLLGRFWVEEAVSKDSPWAMADHAAHRIPGTQACLRHALTYMQRW